MTIFTRAFLFAALERAVKTFAQTAVALVSVAGLGVLDVDWAQVASVSALAAVASLLTSIGSAQVGSSGPSLTTEVTIPRTLG